MITYVIITPGEVAVGYITCEAPPTLDELADKLAADRNFIDRDALIAANPGLTLGWCELH